MTHKQVIISLMLLTALPGWIKGEGTRELQPNKTYSLRLSPSGGGSYGAFATANAGNDNKLWVTIGAVGEKVLFGFQKEDNISVGIYNSAGVNAFPVTALPSSGTGYISTWEQAVAGPSTINPAGYTPFQFTPTAPGDYYIEFSGGSLGAGSEYIMFFDITVVDQANVEKRGRLWSKNWQLYSATKNTTGFGSANTPFFGKMYPYTDDQITTEIEFNGMAPALFNVACNSTGCSNTGNFLIDRKSIDGLHMYPAYKIFLNNPDEALFPTGIIGGVDSVRYSNPCDGSVDISLYVNKPGVAEIVMNINPSPGVQAEDVVLTDSVLDGNASVIHWDGLNGQGELVPNGTTFSIEVTYANGLTHLPLYDVEYSFATYTLNGLDYQNNWPGFIVNLVRPAGAKPRVFWDDRDLAPTSFNLDGCVDPAGCHAWGSKNPPYTIGDLDTYNTWWFAVSTTLVPIAIQYRRSETIPYNYILCEGDSVNVFGNWVNNPGVFSDTLTNFMGCDSISEVTVTVKPGPVIELGDDQVLCQGASTTLGAVVPNVASYEWNTIPPQATPLGTNPTLTVSTTATYQVQITATNGCIRTDQVHVTAAPYINTQPIKHN